MATEQDPATGIVWNYFEKRLAIITIQKPLEECVNNFSCFPAADEVGLYDC
jgi:hypothetical protein